MRHSGVIGPVQRCNVEILPATYRFLAVQLLDSRNLYFAVEPKSKTKELYNQACAHLASLGMLDTDLFGLTFILEDEYVFVDPDCKISKYAPKNWRSSSTHGLDSNGTPLLNFQFRVQFYVESPLLLRDETSRHFYYLQIRQNVVFRGHVCSTTSEEALYLLVGLALQADYGDYDKSAHSGSYFALHNYFPQHLLENVNESDLYRNASTVHQTNHSLPKGQAEIQFIREASSRELFPLAYNSHLYRLKQKKQEPNPGSLLLAVCTRGIELYQEKSVKPISGTLYWNNIGKLCFDRKKFEIKSLNNTNERLVYYTSSDDKSKHLLTLCRLTHQFCMHIQLRAAELAKKEEDEKKQYKEWGTDFSNLKLNSNVCYTHRADQRISVISNTSSNTTSGIVSDRVHSLDESEDDLEMEIMINSPPAASIESLALAHLRDSNYNKLSKFNSNCSQPNMQKEKREDDTTAILSAATKSNVITPALTDGSQCSSSCSTVVINSVPSEHSSNQASSCNIITAHRRHSTNSSLELGYSHTAQNSAISDSASCLEMDYSVQSAHTSSGIYTLQSSCETNTVATATALCSSETSGICHSIIEDSEGGRTRSGSIVSVSGSFHGDGSDPSDTGHGTPLTAEELSDLIVGRSRKPCRGKYPSVATVSESLDSIADYVTLPPPPIPPQYHSAGNLLQHHMTSAASKRSFDKQFIPSYDTKNDIIIKPCRRVLVNSNGAAAAVGTSGNNSSTVAGPSSLGFSKFTSEEEAILQQQIQFRHLAAAGCSSHLLMNTLPGQSLLAKSQIAPSYQSSAATNFRKQPISRQYVNDVPAFNCLQTDCYSRPHKLYNSLLHLNENSLTKSSLNNLATIGLPPSSSCTGAAMIPYSNATVAAQLNHRPLYHYCCANANVGHSTTTTATATGTVKSGSARKANCEPVLGSRLQQPPYVAPIVGNNNYLDFRKTGTALLRQIHEKFPPPPPSSVFHNRQPPPPPPPPLPPPRNQFANQNPSYCQFEQYKQQLYSDVDYVMYPMKDPALSKQEYLDSKLALKHQQRADRFFASHHHPAYSDHFMVAAPACGQQQRVKSYPVYRSTPNVAIADNRACNSLSNASLSSLYGCCQPATAVKFASNRNLSSEYSSSNLSRYPSLASPYSTFGVGPVAGPMSSYSSSTHSLRYDPNSCLTPASHSSNSSCSFMRTQSHDNILNCDLEKASSTTTPVYGLYRPPPPPPPYGFQTSRIRRNDAYTVSADSAEVAPRKLNLPSESALTGDTSNSSNKFQTLQPPADISSDNSNLSSSLDICSLREKSRNLDLPLISALCNDRSLLKQTNTIDINEQNSKRRPLSWHLESTNRQNGHRKKTIFDNIDIDIGAEQNGNSAIELCSSFDKISFKNGNNPSSKSSGNLCALQKPFLKNNSARAKSSKTNDFTIATGNGSSEEKCALENKSSKNCQT